MVRADERTRTALLLQLRVITQELQGVAQTCKSPISKGVSFLYLAEGCTVLRSRWYQSGIKRPPEHWWQVVSVVRGLRAADSFASNIHVWNIFGSLVRPLQPTQKGGHD
jgi:hypothetical protein